MWFIILCKNSCTKLFCGHCLRGISFSSVGGARRALGLICQPIHSYSWCSLVSLQPFAQDLPDLHHVSYLQWGRADTEGAGAAQCCKEWVGLVFAWLNRCCLAGCSLPALSWVWLLPSCGGMEPGRSHLLRSCGCLISRCSCFSYAGDSQAARITIAR